MDKSLIKVDIFTTSEGIEQVSFVLSELGHDSVLITDANDLNKLMDGKYGAWDYIDTELMRLSEVEATITLYLPSDLAGQKSLSDIKKALGKIKSKDAINEFGRLEISISNIKEENWSDFWKKNYKPVTIGKRFIVCPTWESIDLDKRITLKIDPGMAFGTGLDETTRLCLEALEYMVKKNDNVLDIGCGSGILSIGALLLGAGSALGIDIDEISIKTSKENAGLNCVSERSEFICASLFDIKEKTFDIVCANISADVILYLMPEFPRFLKQKGFLILSGIIKNREQDILNALFEFGFSISDIKKDNSWVCVVASY